MNVLSEKTEYVWPHWVQSNLEKITDSESLKNDSSRVVDEGPKGATRGMWMGANKNFLQKKAPAKSQNTHPTQET